MRVLRVILNTNISCNQKGLILRAEDEGVRTEELKGGDVIVFLSTRCTKIKVLAFVDEGLPVMGYYVGDGETVPVDAVNFISKAFGGSGFTLGKSVRAALEKALNGAYKEEMNKRAA